MSESGTTYGNFFSGLFFEPCHFICQTVPDQSRVAYHAFECRGKHDLRQSIPNISELDLVHVERAPINVLPVEHRFIQVPPEELYISILNTLGVEAKQFLIGRRRP